MWFQPSINDEKEKSHAKFKLIKSAKMLVCKCTLLIHTHKFVSKSCECYVLQTLDGKSDQSYYFAQLSKNGTLRIECTELFRKLQQLYVISKRFAYDALPCAMHRSHALNSTNFPKTCPNCNSISISCHHFPLTKN